MEYQLKDFSFRTKKTEARKIYHDPDGCCKLEAVDVVDGDIILTRVDIHCLFAEDDHISHYSARISI